MAQPEISSEQVHVQVGRGAMRLEGENSNAYYAMSNTIEGAVRLGHTRGRGRRQSERSRR
jgi:hypothetical protein